MAGRCAEWLSMGTVGILFSLSELPELENSESSESLEPGSLGVDGSVSE